MDYNSAFISRAHKYKYAIETYPHVLENEFKTVVDVCNNTETDTVLNVTAGCASLDSYFTVKPQKYIEYEPNTTFSKLDNMTQCSFDAIPENDESINIIVTKASLHHLNNEERDKFYKECKRILVKTGKLVFGDVIKNSKEDRWLNIFVNTFNSSGHNGLFFDTSDCELLVKNGYDVKTDVRTYDWVFNSETEMVDFCKHLFGLDLANDDEIANGINTYLCPFKKGGKIVFEWSLLYFISTKAPTLSQ